MPIKANAKKAVRQNIGRTERNKLAGAELDSLRVKVRKLLEVKKVKEAEEVALAVCQKLDKMQSRGISKKNTVSRLKSRLMKKVNALKK